LQLRYKNDLDVCIELFHKYTNDSNNTNNNIHSTIDVNTTINSNNDVIFNGKKTSMSSIINYLLGGSNRGTSYWTYNGKLLVDLYNQKY
jgi:hypothetical protein